MALRNVPVYRPFIQKEELEAVSASLSRGWLGMGADVQEFEARLKQYCQLETKVPVAVSTGHAAIHIALMLAGVGPGDEVVTPAFNNIADFQAVAATGAEIVFCDIDDETLTINPASAMEAISSRTKCIIAMDYNFFLADHDEIKKISSDHGIKILHDAAHSIGSKYKGRPVGSFSDYTIFSFDAVKTFTCIDGGCLVVSDQTEANIAHQMRLIGQGQAPALLYQNSRQWQYDVERVGYRYHMANAHAALGLAQLDKADAIQRSRLETCRFYSDALSGLPSIRVPVCDFKDVNPFMYHVRIEGDRRDEFRSYLADRGVGTGIHWQPGNWFSLFRQCRSTDLSVSNKVGSEIVTLPFHSCMDHEDRVYVVETVRKFAKSI